MLLGEKSMSPPRPRPKRVLLFTNSEHGQANVYLATSHALLTLQDEDVEVHFASFPPIQKSVMATSQFARRENPRARPIVFHAIEGVDMVSAWSRPEIRAEQEALKEEAISITNSLGGLGWIRYAIRRMMLLLKVTLPWTGPEFVHIFQSVVSIVREVQPDITAADPAFSPALTALRHIGADFMILSPNTIKDFAMPVQPNGEALWKYPWYVCLFPPFFFSFSFSPHLSIRIIISPRLIHIIRYSVGSGFEYPVEWNHILANMLMILLAIVCGHFDQNRRQVQAYVAAHAFDDGSSSSSDGGSGKGNGSGSGSVRLTTLNDLSLNPNLGVKFLVANLPELEFPLRVIPGHIIPCGPMIRPAAAVSEVDPELAAWLARGPTLYINLGTHMAFNEEFAVEMATAVRIVLDHARSVLWRDKRLAGLQVLWKLTRFGEYEVATPGSAVYKILGRDVEKGVVRIVDWIGPEPTALLETGNVVCAVHHGGANSFLETVWYVMFFSCHSFSFGTWYWLLILNV
jgi:hypothetical protein